MSGASFQSLLNLIKPVYSITPALEHLIFHHGGREYTIHEALTADEIKTIIEMSEKRDKKLDPFNAKSTRKYFEDTDKMGSAVLRRCFGMSDNQIAGIEITQRRSLVSAFIRFLKTANNI